MSVSALTGILLKLLSKLFLKICRWILVKMSLNCKVCGSSSSGLFAVLKSMKSKESLHSPVYAWKWRKKLAFFGILVLAIGFIWFLCGLSDGKVGLVQKKEVQDSCEGKAQVSLEHFNVSKNQLHALVSHFSESDQITSLKCSREAGPFDDNISCALEGLRSEIANLDDQKPWLTAIIDPQNQCPARDWKHPDISLLHEKSMTKIQRSSFSLVSKNLPKAEKSRSHDGKMSLHFSSLLTAVLPTRTSDCVMESCWSFSAYAIIICWAVLVTMIISCKISVFLFRSESSIHSVSVVKQMETAQQHKTEASTDSPPKSGGKWRKYFLAAFLVSGVIGSIWLFHYMYADFNFRREETLVNMCDERARMLQDQFNVSMNHVHALAVLISTFHHGKHPSAIDQKTFGEYTERTSFERPLTSGVSYALRVTHSEREAFERRHGWTIKKMLAEDQTLAQDCVPEKLEPSPVQDEYAPVIFSQDTVAHIVSIDMMSGKEDRENILRARESGKGVLTSPLFLLKSNQLGVILTFAVYNADVPLDATPEQRINATVGYLGASYDVPSLVEKLLHQLASKQTIVVNVYDITNRYKPIKMYGGDVVDTGLLHISSLDFGDPARKHEMHCRFKQKAPLPWSAIVASVGALVITLLLSYIFYGAINQIDKVEAYCREMERLKKSAESADKAKSQFLATVSHEIRTPMNGVLGMLQMLMNTGLDANQLDYAQTAHASGKDLISLINEVLDQAKIESGKLELEDVHFDLRATLDSVLSLFSSKSQERGLELAVYVSDRVPEVLVGDPGRFRQIITNLVGNSTKFTHDKGHILVSVHMEDEIRAPLYARDKVLGHGLSCELKRSHSFETLSGFPVVDRWRSWEEFKSLGSTSSTEETEIIKLLVTVEDTGLGIPQAAQERIFMPFMQADSSTSRTYGGTGIGLSISKRLVDLMGGEIGFVSELGTGSTFSFTVVFKKGQRSSLETKWQHNDGIISDFQGLKALVVDERSIRAEVTRYHLQRLGILVDIVSSMESACAYLSATTETSLSRQLAMVLVDKDIYSKESHLAVQLKELRQTARVGVTESSPKIFLLATSIRPTYLDDIKSSGLVENFLLKPLSLSALRVCFQESLLSGKKRYVNRGKQQSIIGGLLKGKRFLVVDDNKVNQRVAQGALRKYGAIVTCVDSGKAALDKLKPPHEFDACFMDIQMPEMDGFQATEQIRLMEHEFNESIESGKASSHWHTPILAMTADLIQATHEECIRKGMDGYVTKPFEEEQLYSAVARFFKSG